MNSASPKVLLLFLIGPFVFADRAEAMDPDTAPLVPSCAFPSTVRIAGHCTGSYLGNGVVLTAAHCMDSETISSVTFGDADSGSNRFTVSVDGCVGHPDGDLLHVGNGIYHYSGVDLGVCVLDPVDPDYDKLASLPTAPLMAPTGCIRDWLRHELYVIHDCPQTQKKGRTGCSPQLALPSDGTFPGVDAIAVGMGSEGGSQSGHKRSFHPTLYTQVNNEELGGFAGSKPGSPTQIATEAETMWDGTPIPGDGVLVGDSGGPVLYQLPDDTWWVVGDLNGEGYGSMNYYEAAPAYMHWIENTTLRDVTPCYDRNSEDEFIWNGDCIGTLPTSIHNSGGGLWTNSCSDHDVGGQACGGFGPNSPLDFSSGMQPMPNHPWVSFAAVEAHQSATLSLANSGYFGDPVDIDSVQAYLYDEAYDSSAYTFLTDIFDAGVVGSYSSSALVGDFDGDQENDQVFSEPDYDCGKGRIIVINDDDSQETWTLDTSGVLGTAACEDYFGAGLSVGDFNDDGYDDLAISAPGETVSSKSGAGVLHILYGSSSGLTDVGDQTLHQDSTGIGGPPAAWGFFGELLDSGDFDCDGYEDLAVGTPRATIEGIYEAGSVHVIYGSAGGLSTVSVQLYEGRAGIDDSPGTEEQFGGGLAVGNFNGDSCSDLAIGVPGEDSTSNADIGKVHVLYGTSTGLPQDADLTLTQGQGGVADSASANDRFGARLDVVVGTSTDSLRTLVPNELCNTTTDHPMVGWHVFQGGTAGLDLTTDSLECEVLLESPISTATWGDLEQAARLYAVRIAREATP